MTEIVKKTAMLTLYHYCMTAGKPLLNALLTQRVKRGKEDQTRLNERRGAPTKARPKGNLIWVHAASVGEAQSALVLIRELLKTAPKKHVLLTTGTKSSAVLMEKRLPDGAFHQFFPLDHPEWVSSFLEYWAPDAVLWMESELWPNMLTAIQERGLPLALINGRLSPKSAKNWAFFKTSIAKLLSGFSLILTQSEEEAKAFRALGAHTVYATGNLKYSAHALNADEQALKALNGAMLERPCWLYASTHKGEEDMAARIHERLKNRIPELLTIIAPRHPERSDDIQADLSDFDLNIMLRGDEHALPRQDTDIYIANTLGELGLFYRAAPIACIGRSFSDDGGGGHNPIEAAQLHCAVLYGPHVQNQQDIYDDMQAAGAAHMMRDEHHLTQTLEEWLRSPKILEEVSQTASTFAHQKAKVIETVLDHLNPLLQDVFLKRNMSNNTGKES